MSVEYSLLGNFWLFYLWSFEVLAFPNFVWYNFLFMTGLMYSVHTASERQFLNLIPEYKLSYGHFALFPIIFHCYAALQARKEPIN